LRGKADQSVRELDQSSVWPVPGGFTFGEASLCRAAPAAHFRVPVNPPAVLFPSTSQGVLSSLGGIGVSLQNINCGRPSPFFNLINLLPSTRVFLSGSQSPTHRASILPPGNLVSSISASCSNPVSPVAAFSPTAPQNPPNSPSVSSALVRANAPVQSRAQSRAPSPINTPPPPPANTPRMSRWEMPAPITARAPKWDSKVENLTDFIWRIDHTCESVGLSDEAEKMKWVLAYVLHDVRTEWLAIPKSQGDWRDFKEKLKEEYPELVEKEIGLVGVMRELCLRFYLIGISKQLRLLGFRRKFQVLADKCLKALALISNQELVEAFVKCLDPFFQEQLNRELYTSGSLRNVGPDVKA
jgi:hypothetical protein